MKLTPALAALAVLAVVAVGCSSDDSSTTTTTSKATTTVAPAATGAVTVSAAASLTEAFTTIKDRFIAANPGATVTTNFGSSGQLATQIQNGAPADVAAFADEAPMTTLADAGLLAAPPKVFARNELVIVTKPGNPKKVTSLADLATVGTVSLCAATAPCGKFAGQALTKAGVTIPESSITRGPDVKAALAAVTQGDAEAAVVYVTDAKAAGTKVATIEIPTAANVVASYPITVVKASANPSAARAFEDFVLGPEGQTALKDAGFLAP
ncbi:MAG: molybdate ABC transporter substrate-binding protein [Microthrixaceae bacterium]